MRLPLLLAITAVGACATAPSGPATGPPAGAASAPVDRPTANVSVVREPEGGGVVFVSFRAEGGVPISAGHALRVETPSGDFEAPLAGVPERVAEGTVTVSSAEYRLAEAGVRALDAAGDRARVAVHDGRAYQTYAVRRGDLLE